MSIAPSASALHRPIGIFDAGIGSYAIVDLVRRHYPRQDIIYFADRASFPYGSRTPGELAASVGAAIERLAGLGAQAVVLASNAPSVMVLDTIRAAMPVPVLGIYPPIADALAQSRSGHIAVLGVQSLIGSPEIRTYISREAQSVLQASAAPASPPATATTTGSAAPAGRPADNIGPVTLVNASSLVAHVEDGRFLSAPEATQLAVTDFMRQLRQDLPLLDTCTLSSTHLPWLRRYFEAAAPDMLFLDPAQALLPLLQPHVSTGSGKVLCLASATPAYPLDGLRQMLRLLGVDIEPFAV